MYTGMLQRFDPDDPRWGAAPSRPPEVVISAERESLKARRLSCALVSYDWVVDGGTESARPDEPFDTSDVEVLDVEGADTIRFEIHSSASPVSITVTRLFDLDADNPEDFESVAHLLSPGQPEPDGLELRRVESEGDPHWRLDVQIVPVQEASHVSLQAFWSDTPMRLALEYMAAWIAGLSGDPSGQSRAERIELRDKRRDESGTHRPVVGDGGPIRWTPLIDTADLDEKVSAMMRSPLGRAMATIAAGSGMSAREMAVPETSVWLCVEASDSIEVWRADRDEILAFLELDASKHEAFLQEILSQPSASWWFEPLTRDRQVWVSKDGKPPSEDSLVTPSEPPTRWERYALKPEGWLFTSTQIGDISPMAAAIDYGVGDLRVGGEKPPYAVWRMEVDESARIFEIHGPNDWHRLCVEYPAEGNSGCAAGNEPDFSLDPGKLVPNWSLVARDWDAVHLSFGGYLTSEQVRVESDKGWTYHWAWNHEKTLWLRWMFIGYERLEDYNGGDSVRPYFNYKLFFAAMNAAELSE